MTVVLTNRGPRFRTFVLTHERYCAARGVCGCAKSPDRTARRIPGALLLARDASSTNLDDAVLAVPEIAQAIRMGDVTVKQTASAVSPRPPAPISSDSEERLTRETKKKRGG